ncbi:MAG: outer membrane lipoprotein carrier protein LolA [Pseudomonadota bacterium]
MRFKMIFLSLICLIFSTPLFCADIDAVLSEVEQNMGNVKTIQGDFVQKKHMAMFDTPITIKGKLFIQHPDKFAWIVIDPIEYTLIITEKKIKKWDQSNGTQELSLKANPMFKAMVEQITFWFSGNYASCKKDYDISLINNDPIILEFTPKPHNPASKMLTKITLVFQKDRKYLSIIKLLEQNEDTTELIFNDVKVNSKIDPSVWELN